MILDDAFASLDRFSTESITNHLFGHGGKMSNDVTVVIMARDPGMFHLFLYVRVRVNDLRSTVLQYCTSILHYW